ncbi:MAG: S41 family peptidase [Chloroflexota bacterium]|nr:S41 family peptidase [Chloroflexota bacterium]
MTIRLNRWAVTAGAVLALILFFLVGGLAGYLYAHERGIGTTTAALPVDTGKGDKSREDRWKPFWQTYDLIKKEYYGRPVDEQKLIDGAAEGMVQSLGDPYTSYLPPQQNEEAREELRGRFEGIGVYVDVKDKQFVIVAPIDGSPAAEAGLKRGDIILAVNGKSIAGMDQQDVIRMIRGPKNTTVLLTIKRGNQKPFDRKVRRDEIEVPQVTYKRVDGNIGYIDVNIFGDQTTPELDAALKRAQQDKVKGIILDLRDNGGGWVEAARNMVGRFLPDGVVMYEDKTRGPGGEEALNVLKGDVEAYKTPLVVLVNKGTASASEIVSGALQARHRATLVGDVTFCKGSEQLVHTLEGGSSAHITVAHWLTPAKVDIHGKGLRPNLVVKTSANDVEDSGPQFQRALTTLRAEIK